MSPLAWVTLAGTLMLPKDAVPLDLELLEADLEAGRPAPRRQEGVVVLAHDFLTDRHGLDHRLDRMAAAYREAGLATLAFDFSGQGESDDDVVSAKSTRASLHRSPNAACAKRRR